MANLAGDWALILGSSSGFGATTARKLAAKGMNIAGVHFDRKSDLPEVEELIEELRDEGVEVVFFNSNAAKEKTRDKVIEEIQSRKDEGAKVKLLMHSLAFGTLKKFVNGGEDDLVKPSQMEMTLDVMASTLVYWTQRIVEPGLMVEGGRIFAMTSAGGSTAWPYYGPVSAAKSALEANIRQLAYELADKGITANAIQAGVTDTPALRKIPGNKDMISEARRRNPSGRITETEDVAKFISLMAEEGSQYVTGNVIRCDGGEGIVS